MNQLQQALDRFLAELARQAMQQAQRRRRTSSR